MEHVRPVVDSVSFDPKIAFSRSLGWLTVPEQERLASTHVGIIGMGGVGGQYAEVLARLGVGRFTLCDPDRFSIENTNRQNECKTSNYGRNKAEVMRELILDINPSAKVTIIPNAMRFEQVNAFCEAIDIYLDALDFFEIDVRLAIFRRMREIGKPSVTSAPVGAGAATLVFTADSMSFDDYFGMHLNNDMVDRAVRFLVGLTPSFQHSAYLVDRTRLDFANRKTPSLPMGVVACAAVMGTLVMKLMLGRGRIQAAPWSIHYDSYRTRIVKKYIWWGYRNPLQRLKFWVLKRQIQKVLAQKKT